ncbi:MAG: methyltransferase domain-containing protein [Gammaproteobacteria bacterium]|nr:methyltransferase domain-containing protein [Gammaproteobacteria bacterium]
MKRPARGSDYPELAQENRAIWNANAAWWDQTIGDGNDFQDHLIEPASEKLLEVVPGDRVLDIACGAGRLTRRLAGAGARVTAFDQAEAFIELARSKSTGLDIDYRVVDAGEEAELLALGERAFDKAVCTMALMDMPDLTPLFRSLPKLLAPRGRFVFTVTHPCFHSAGVATFAEMQEDANGRLQSVSGVKVTRYLAPFAKKTEGVLGQPAPQYAFHRPLGVLLGYGFANGFVIDAMSEPRLPVTDIEAGLRWRNMPDIPPVLAVRMRLDQ